jgi:hypothetical protein
MLRDDGRNDVNRGVTDSEEIPDSSMSKPVSENCEASPREAAGDGCVIPHAATPRTVSGTASAECTVPVDSARVLHFVQKTEPFSSGDPQSVQKRDRDCAAVKSRRVPHEMQTACSSARGALQVLQMLFMRSLKFSIRRIPMFELALFHNFRKTP